MNRIFRGLAATAMLSALFAAPVLAQESQLLDDKFTVKAGIFMPQSSEAKDVGKQWLTGGLEYAIGNQEGRRVLSVEAMYTSREDDVTVNNLTLDTELSMWSLAVNYKMREIRSGDSDTVKFYGAGLGIFGTKVKVDNPVDDTLSIDDDKTSLGAHIFAGAELYQNFQLEARYTWVFSDNNDVDFNGIMVLAGLKI